MPTPEADAFTAEERAALAPYFTNLDRRGEPIQVEAEGFLARVLQHECDHLEGSVYLDRMKEMTSLSFLEEWERYLEE